jgi:hypothetical protein
MEKIDLGKIINSRPITLSTGLMLFLWGGATYLNILNSDRQIPRTKQVQEGYIAPKNIEIHCKDLDGNGEPETIMKINNQNYLLREINGQPVLSMYKIKPID